MVTRRRSKLPEKKFRSGGIAAALAAGLAAAGPASAAECSKMVVSGHPGYPPLVYYDGHEMRGAWMAIASRILSDLDIPFELSYEGPWSRVLESAMEAKIDLIATLKESPERLAYLSFTTTPAVYADIALFVRSDSTLQYHGWPDLIGKLGGIVRDEHYGLGFDEFMRSHLTVETVTSIDLDFKMLEAGHVDYAVTGYYPGLAHIASLGFEDRLKAVQPLISQTVNGFAFVTASPCLKYLPAFDKQLAVLVKNGTVQRLVDENLRNWQLKPLDLSN
ncbi:hypothetical protein GCM10011611_61740 [Aliidongia dinghuensis]|uniref:Solute-binding protein family 3/N-terminal domain-containing protein n=1 Tax=Aliidongia dinghuensis TaxID=1867774 RepID=A0A8J2YZN9_9PROT|nr:transporter substrate-binding domain-containing protein [Aliidongia dinghuensis]GGF46979.1 hypothetical protein GCM10011611_61740 [Aliidongia dinghuensis]